MSFFDISREELRRWFIAQELDLFRFRFQNENKENVKLFLENNNLNYDLVSMIVLLYEKKKLGIVLKLKTLFKKI